MSDGVSFQPNQAEPVTVEASYTVPGRENACLERWTFYNQPPEVAKDLVIQKLVPLDATLSRVYHWRGLPEDLAENG